MSAVGKNYETTAADINDPISEWYVMPPVSSMDCGTLQQNYTTLNSQIQYWNGVLHGANSKEVANIAKILQAQQTKLNGYAQLLTTQCQTTHDVGPGTTPPITPPAIDYSDIPTDAGDSSAGNGTGAKVMTWIKANPALAALAGAGIGFAIYEIVEHNKKQNRTRISNTRKK